MKPFLLCLAAVTALAADIDFLKDVQPILASKCFSCHNGDVAQAGLRLDRRQPAMRGGDYGPVIIAGDSAKSKLIRRVVNGDGGLRMPPTEPLSQDEIDILKAWIDQGADYRLDIAEPPAPPAMSKDLKALFEAIQTRVDPRVSALLAANPDLAKQADEFGSTPLHYAAAYGTRAAMKMLLDNGADVNAKNRRKSTPLFWALYDEARVRMLVDAGADLKVRVNEGYTVVRQAALMGNANRVLALLLDKGGDPNTAAINGTTALMAAASRGNVAAMELLLKHGAKADALSGAGSSALISAAGSKSPAAVQLLLERGANPNTTTKRGDTALHIAATEGVEQSVRLLLAKGAKVNVQDERGYTPLMHAAASDAMPAGIVKLLLDKGADASLKAEYDATAATLAAKMGDSPVAKLLRASCVKPQAKFNDKPLPAREAAAKAIPMLEKQSFNFIRIGGCNSCHSQDLSSIAAGLAGKNAVPQLENLMNGQRPERILDLQVVASVGVSWELFDDGMNRRPRTPYTDAATQYLRMMQTSDGHFTTPMGKRAPMASGEAQNVALAIYGLRHYTAPAQQAESDAAIARARGWLERQQLTKTQDLAFQLMGLAWSKGSAEVIARVRKDLLARQSADGGWSQFPTMASDAYATGQVLFALKTADMPVTGDAYVKGKDYLVRTQAPDGTWHVKTRAIWLQPYFESGFPYGVDQFISTAGTAWASIALSLAAH